MPPVSILIATHNNEDIIARCLESVQKQTYNKFEVIVVNDASTDRTLEIANSFPASDGRFKIFSLEKSGGCPGARNEAIKKASGDILAFLDADATVEPNWLELMLRPFEDPAVGCVGGPDSVPEECSLVARCIDYSMHSLIASAGLRRGGSKLAPYLPAGCNMFVRKSVVEQIGLFDQTMLKRGEEKEFLNRISKAGYKIKYVERGGIWHFRRTTIPAFWRQMYLSGVARIDIIKRAPEQFHWAHLAPAFLVGFLILGFFLSAFFTTFANWYYLVLGLLIFLFIVDGILAAERFSDLKALLITPITSAIVPIGYGLGMIMKLIGRE